MFKTAPWLRFYNGVKKPLRITVDLGKKKLGTCYAAVTRNVFFFNFTFFTLKKETFCLFFYSAIIIR
jgi:hypothetical protein